MMIKQHVLELLTGCDELAALVADRIYASKPNAKKLPAPPYIVFHSELDTSRSPAGFNPAPGDLEHYDIYCDVFCVNDSDFDSILSVFLNNVRYLDSVLRMSMKSFNATNEVIGLEFRGQIQFSVWSA